MGNPTDSIVLGPTLKLFLCLFTIKCSFHQFFSSQRDIWLSKRTKMNATPCQKLSCTWIVILTVYFNSLTLNLLHILYKKNNKKIILPTYRPYCFWSCYPKQTFFLFCLNFASPPQSFIGNQYLLTG